MFKIGQKVVALCDSETGNRSQSLKKGQIYTVKSYLYYTYLRMYVVMLNETNDALWHPVLDVSPLDEIFAESVLENIKEQIKEEEWILS